MKLKNILLLSGVGFSSMAMAEDMASSFSNNFSSMFIFGVMFVFMYFFMIRPQNKKQKEQQNMLANLVQGDEILTQSGLVGKIIKDGPNFLSISTGNDTEIFVQRQSVIQVLPKGTLKTI